MTVRPELLVTGTVAGRPIRGVFPLEDFEARLWEQETGGGTRTSHYRDDTVDLTYRLVLRDGRLP